jgi:hypothetical protein
MNAETTAGRILKAFRSVRTGIGLMIILALLSALGTLTARNAPSGELPTGGLQKGFESTARLLGLTETFSSPLFLILLATLAANIALCTAHRVGARSGTNRQARGLQRQEAAFWLDVCMHLSLLILLAGGAAKGLYGYARTQYLFLDVPVGEAWDASARADLPIGFEVTLREKRETFFPARARLGVTRQPGNVRLGLVEIREGGRPADAGDGIRAALETGTSDETVRVTVERGGERVLLSFETRPSGRNSADAFGRIFTLVAHRRDLKTVEGLVSVSRGGKEVARSWFGPNAPFEFQGTRLFPIGWGREYLGLQVGRDPGGWLFWVGGVLLSLSLPLMLVLRHTRGGMRHAEKRGGG